MLNGYTPIFSQFGNDIYASDVVQQAIVCIVDEMKKLQLVHERTIGSDLTTVDNFLQPVLDNPNPIMTQSEFIENSCGYCCLIIIVLYFQFGKVEK